jgi:hypothetical protein
LLEHSQLRLTGGDGCRYIRHSFRDLMKNVKKKEGSVPGTYVDIDGVGECVDTFRGMGLTEASDRCCCEGSAYLLRTQLKNGSFPLWFPEGQSATSHYDNLHSTWVCAMQPLCSPTPVLVVTTSMIIIAL